MSNTFRGKLLPDISRNIKCFMHIRNFVLYWKQLLTSGEDNGI